MVRGSVIWYEVIWSGTWYEIWYEVIWFGTWFENLVRCYLVRSEIGDFSVPIWYELLIWYGTIFFRPDYFNLKNTLIIKKYVRSDTRTEPISNRLIWFVIGSVRNFSIKFFQNVKIDYWTGPEFLKRDSEIHGLLNRPDFLKGDAGINEPPN